MAKQYNNYSSLITFTRASSGTALRPISYGDELVSNGTFDTDSDWIKQTGWSISGGSANWDGVSSVYIQQGDVFEPNTLYTITFTISNNTSGTISIRDGAAAVLVPNTTYANGTYSFNVVSTSNSSLRIYGVSGSGSLSIDNISVREVLFDQPDGTLTLFNHPTNIPRIEYDSDGNRLGLLVEEARTNLVEYSEDFEQWLAFNYGGAYLAIDYGYASPDGSNNASKLTYTEGSGSNGSLLATNITATASLDYSLSIWMKGQVGGEKVRVDFRNNASSGIAGDIITLTSEWKKYSVTVTNNTGTTRGFQFRLTSLDSIVSQTFYIYGAQLEAGSFPTSYIPTSGSTATRSADVASIGVSEFGYNQKSGTVVVDFKTPIGSAGYIGDQTVASAIAYSSSADFKTFNGTSTATTSNTFTLNQPAKGAVAYDESERAVCLDGGTVVSNSGELQNVTTFRFGQAFGGNYLNGHIKSIKYYPRRLTNSQLVEITS